MPSWEFECLKCGHSFLGSYMSWEEMMKAQVTRCPRAMCEGRVERKPSAPNFIVHGLSAKNGYSR
jgi:DNA-directed RNA polymerase subunit RPC12/RpoP